MLLITLGSSEMYAFFPLCAKKSHKGSSSVVTCLLWGLFPWKMISHYLCFCVHVLSHFSHVWLFVTLWTVVYQAPLSTGFSRQGYWSELPCPPPGDCPDPGNQIHISYVSALAGGFFTTSALWEAHLYFSDCQMPEKFFGTKTETFSNF